MPSSFRFAKVPIASALTAALGSTLATSGAVAQTEQKARLEEVVVTARKRSESALDIPISVQALGGEMLKDFRLRNVAEIARFVPELTTRDIGAGQTDIIFRGASTGFSYTTQSTTSLYLDEVSLTTQGEQPYVYAVDMARAEALAGPQGTLYGADSQAGTLRMITNAPDPSGFEVIVDGMLRDGSEGEESYDGSVVVNLPLIEDTLTLRVVGYTSKDGGFVDNVFGRTTLDRKAEAIYGRSPSGWGTLDNADVVEDDINDFRVDGFRAALRWDVNENWTATGMYMNQSSDAGSYNFTDDYAGDLATVLYNEEFFDIEYDVASLVIEGDLGFAQLVSATGYYDQSGEFFQDQTTYVRAYAAYYCFEADPSYVYFTAPNGEAVYFGGYCGAPTVEGDFFNAGKQFNGADRFVQELRLSGDSDRLEWIVGGFYEESSAFYEEFFGGVTGNENGRGVTEDLYQDSISLAYAEFFTGPLPDSTVPFYAKQVVDFEQWAVFGELTYNITDKLDVTVGGRYFDRESTFNYNEEALAEGVPDSAPLVGETQSDQEFAPKIGLSYDLTDTSMIYGLRSVGFRPGGVNRFRGVPAFGETYDPDEMINWEVGYKGTIGGNLNVQAAAFLMDWEGYQFSAVDPAVGPCPDGGSIPGVCGQPYQFNVSNAGDASITGITLHFDWGVTDNLTLGLNGTWIEAETDTAVDFEDDGEVDIPKGAKLPNAADVSGSAWATYRFPVNRLKAEGFVHLQWSYSDERLSQIAESPIEDITNSFPQFTMPAYDIGDLSVGLEGSSWEASIFVNNITDERANLGHRNLGGWSQYNAEDGRDHVAPYYTNRPREFGVRVVKRWGGG
ncbi:hypothetical protein NOR51B_558 [Luminiphilus syltensis NOR5-1B]|uniref:TonB-dependent receptor n=1 Tax=Luminiphilus syltensis NOR5-1B TaxID=565045 RepID=B8KTT4_9GAMM|nr:TonB-dependent receptor [Luminiphilus syltensis]EED34620.1 hypothetical protein NOR51B_558 [Luminiphilus syltensis NOR5-1B]